MNGAGDQLLAGAAFAEDQHRFASAATRPIVLNTCIMAGVRPTISSSSVARRHLSDAIGRGPAPGR